MSTFGYYMAASGANIPTTITAENDGNAYTFTNDATNVNTSTAINNPTVSNSTPVQTKKYFCKHHVHIDAPSSITDHTHEGSHKRHGYNDSHDTKDCRTLNTEKAQTKVSIRQRFYFNTRALSD